MDRGTLLATVSGGSLAMAGTVLADRLRHRHENDRTGGPRRRTVHVEFIGAVGECHARLRQLAQDPDAVGGLEGATRGALRDAGVHEARERLFLDATGASTASPASPASPAFHDTYHPYIGAARSYRVAVREELEGRSLSPAAFGWADWDGTDRCPMCRRAERAADGAPGRR